ncbi:uncharacterized protein B0I36DRAFT_351052 [Microdochium trichocladiopsis]|uniref:Uncharacterized protein n=1 Tax=Microdochium trichocladiopsis TaxID=1682393 RepID=A0A9P9BKZ1_9PEZI|nr:uncharacterized protein B0I36DRAFT_351052 [Microdochium trichocladiopsis]KAH7027532.1 hypothetical protein B0I36DRAFT_351052 [Microdochium trichocladiopsis]
MSRYTDHLSGDWPQVGPFVNEWPHIHRHAQMNDSSYSGGLFPRTGSRNNGDYFSLGHMPSPSRPAIPRSPSLLLSRRNTAPAVSLSSLAGSSSETWSWGGMNLNEGTRPHSSNSTLYSEISRPDLVPTRSSIDRCTASSHNHSHGHNRSRNNYDSLRELLKRNYTLPASSRPLSKNNKDSNTTAKDTTTCMTRYMALAFPPTKTALSLCRGKSIDQQTREKKTPAIHCSLHERDYHCPCASCARYRRTRRQTPRSVRSSVASYSSGGSSGSSTTATMTRTTTTSSSSTTTTTTTSSSTTETRKTTVMAAATALQAALRAASRAIDSDHHTNAAASSSSTTTTTTARLLTETTITRTTSCSSASSSPTTTTSFTDITELTSAAMLFEYKERLGRLRARQAHALRRREDEHAERKSRVRRAINVDFGYLKSESEIWEERIRLEEEKQNSRDQKQQRKQKQQHQEQEQEEEKPTLLLKFGTAARIRSSQARSQLLPAPNQLHDEDCAESDETWQEEEKKKTLAAKMRKTTIQAIKPVFWQFLMLKKVLALEHDHQLDLDRLRQIHAEQDRELYEEYSQVNNRTYPPCPPPQNVEKRLSGRWRSWVVTIGDNKNWQVLQSQGVE